MVIAEERTWIQKVVCTTTHWTRRKERNSMRLCSSFKVVLSSHGNNLRKYQVLAVVRLFFLSFYSYSWIFLRQDRFYLSRLIFRTFFFSCSDVTDCHVTISLLSLLSVSLSQLEQSSLQDSIYLNDRYPHLKHRKPSFLSVTPASHATKVSGHVKQTRKMCIEINNQ